MISQTIGSLGTLPDASTQSDDVYAANAAAVMAALVLRLSEMSTVISQWNADLAKYTPVDHAFSATPTFDASAGYVHTMGVMTANVTTFTISGGNPGDTIRIRFTEDGTGGRSVTPPANVKFSGSIDTTAGRSTWLILTKVGTVDGVAVNRWEGVAEQVGA